MKNLLVAAATTAVLATGASAATVNIDFEALAADIGEQGVEGQTFNFGALGVTLSSIYTPGPSDAYLDGVSGGLPAGLGICSTGLTPSKQCIVSSDDNITVDEAVTLTFSQAVLGVGDFVFRAANHVDISSSTEFLMVGYNGLARNAVMFADVADYLNGLGADMNSLTFEFADTEFYVSVFSAEIASVPLPASILLLGGAIGGLGAMRRRKKVS